MCPQPVASPATDPDNAWRINTGSPPGHAFCGNWSVIYSVLFMRLGVTIFRSEVLLALRAPSTSRCDFCQVSFCGINVQGRCVALPIAAQSLHGMMDVTDLIQSPEIYECFEGNSAEVEVMLDYMRTQHLTPRQIYRQVSDLHGVSTSNRTTVFRSQRISNPNRTASARLSSKICSRISTLSQVGLIQTRRHHVGLSAGCVRQRYSYTDCVIGGFVNAGRPSRRAHSKTGKTAMKVHLATV